MSTTYNGIPKILNGDTVIGFTSTQKIKDLGWVDKASLSSWYREDTTKNHMGLISLFSNFSGEKLAVMKDLFAKKAMIEVNGMDGKFTYDLPVYKPLGTFTMEDTSYEFEAPGIEEGFFTIVLSKPYQPGDVLTYDKMYGEQFVISEEHEVYQEGDNYRHYAQMVTLDNRAYYPNEKLKAGIQYWKVGHVTHEYGTKFSNIESPDNAGTITCEFQLGNHRGVQTDVTMYADKKSISGARTESRQFWDYFTQEQAKIVDDKGRQLDMMVVGKLDKATGQINSATAKISATMEYLILLENMKLEANQLLFQKGGIIKGTNGGVKRLNEGAWHQIRRGRKITYSRPGGITREHIRQAVAYVFQGRQDIAPMNRVIKFKVGSGAYQNFMVIFREEFNNQLTSLTRFMGTDRNIPNPVSGSLEGLSLAAVVLKSVPIPDIGIVEVEHDPSLDFNLGADRFSRGMFSQGFSKDSYSAVIWDASSSEYSNARAKLPTGVSLIDGGNKDANVYYVKPQGDAMWWGYEQGRWNPNKASDIMSSSKTMGIEYWVHSASAAWIRDTSKFLIIELKR
jgi:hypothetical protein